MKPYKYIIAVVVIAIFLALVISTKEGQIKLTDKYYNEGKFVENIDISTIKNENYILYVYNPYCSFPVPCEAIFKSFMDEYKIDIVSLPFSEFKNTYLYQTVKYAPSIIVVKNGRIVAYLDANSDKDTQKYQDEEAFKTWIEKYVYLNNN